MEDFLALAESESQRLVAKQIVSIFFLIIVRGGPSRKLLFLQCTGVAMPESVRCTKKLSGQFSFHG